MPTPRRIVRVLCLLVCLTSWDRSGVQARDTLADRLQPILAAHHGKVSVSVKHLGTGEEFHFEADRPMPTASLIKLPLLVAAYGKIHRGELSLAQRIVLREDDKVPGSGILTDHFSPGLELSLRDALHLMTVFSDNTATNLVVDQVGLLELNRELAALGLPETRMNSKVYRRVDSVDPARSAQFGLGSTTSREMVRLLELLERGEPYGAEAWQQMKAHLLVCEDRTKLLRSLPPNVPVAHKSGEVSESRTEAGILYTASGPIAICVLTTDNEDQRFAADNAAHALIGRLAESTYWYFNPRGEPLAANAVLKNGAQGERVADLQRTLNARLQPSPELSVDGEWGPATEAAVRAFQQQSQLAVTGEVDQAFWERLGPLVAAEQENAAELTPLADPDPPQGFPFVTAAAWSILDGESGAILAEHAGDSVREIASTTKIMTAWVILERAQRDRELLNEVVTFSARASATEGSSCELRPGEQATVDQLLYGLLLPSGNDAAIALAEHFGSRFSPVADESDPLSGFVAAMNKANEPLGLVHSHWTNPNGLPDPENHSTANELGKLSVAAMELEDFRRYVGTRRYTARVAGPGGYQRVVTWTNTNQLLDIAGYGGIKTGTTQAAGACLVGEGSQGDRRRVVVVLGSASTAARYADIRNLFRWAWMH